MSVGSDTKFEEALALVDRMPVWDGLVLSGVGPCAAAPASCQSRHADSRGRCPDTSEAIDVRAEAMHRRRRSVESP